VARILIIDDDKPVRDSLGAMLSAVGHDVRLAAHGREGIDCVPSFRPQLVITDLLMPEMEGMETIRILRQLQPDLPIIAISGRERYREIDYLDLAGRLGASQALRKPVSPARLLMVISQLLTRIGPLPLAPV